MYTYILFYYILYINYIYNIYIYIFFPQIKENSSFCLLYLFFFNETLRKKNHFTLTVFISSCVQM